MATEKLIVHGDGNSNGKVIVRDLETGEKLAEHLMSEPSYIYDVIGIDDGSYIVHRDHQGASDTARVSRHFIGQAPDYELASGEGAGYVMDSSPVYGGVHGPNINDQFLFHSGSKAQIRSIDGGFEDSYDITLQSGNDRTALTSDGFYVVQPSKTNLAWYMANEPNASGYGVTLIDGTVPSGLWWSRPGTPRASQETLDHTAFAFSQGPVRLISYQHSLSKRLDLDLGGATFTNLQHSACQPAWGVTDDGEEVVGLLYQVRTPSATFPPRFVVAKKGEDELEITSQNLSPISQAAWGMSGSRGAQSDALGNKMVVYGPDRLLCFDLNNGEVLWQKVVEGWGVQGVAIIEREIPAEPEPPTQIENAFAALTLRVEQAPGAFTVNEEIYVLRLDPGPDPETSPDPEVHAHLTLFDVVPDAVPNYPVHGQGITVLHVVASGEDVFVGAYFVQGPPGIHGLFCFDVDGNILWHHQEPSPLQGTLTSQHAKIHDGILYANSPGSNAGKGLEAWNLHTGDRLWTADQGLAPPVAQQSVQPWAITPDGQRISGVSAAYNGRIIQIDLATGDVVYSRDINATMNFALERSDGNLVYQERFAGHRAIDRDTGALLWSGAQTGSDLIAWDADTMIARPGAVRWNLATGDSETLSLDFRAFAGDFLAGYASNTNNWNGRPLTGGPTTWTFDLPTRAKGIFDPSGQILGLQLGQVVWLFNENGLVRTYGTTGWIADLVGDRNVTESLPEFMHFHLLLDVPEPPPEIYAGLTQRVEQYPNSWDVNEEIFVLRLARGPDSETSPEPEIHAHLTLVDVEPEKVPNYPAHGQGDSAFHLIASGEGVFIGSYWVDDLYGLFAFDHDGNIIWHHREPATVFSGTVTANLAKIHNGILFVASPGWQTERRLEAWGLHTGDQLWVADVALSTGGNESQQPWAVTPDGQRISGVDMATNRRLIQIDIATGDIVYDRQMNFDVFWCVERADGSLVFHRAGYWLRAINRDTGTTLWTGVSEQWTGLVAWDANTVTTRVDNQIRLWDLNAGVHQVLTSPASFAFSEEFLASWTVHDWHGMPLTGEPYTWTFDELSSLPKANFDPSGRLFALQLNQVVWLFDESGRVLTYGTSSWINDLVGSREVYESFPELKHFHLLEAEEIELPELTFIPPLRLFQRDDDADRPGGAMVAPRVPMGASSRQRSVRIGPSSFW